MPYSLDETPERLKGKGIPRKFIRMFIHTWNSVYERTGSETKAFKAAYAVMGRALRKAGYTKDEDGKWHRSEEAREMSITEGWLSVSQNTLDDGDFAWVSNAYKKASPAEREKMNKGEHRKLPYKIHGKVNVRGWRAAWIAVANPGSARALKSYKGGPSREQVLAKLRRSKPKGITIGNDNSITSEGVEAMGENMLLATSQKLHILEETENGELHFEGVAFVDNVLSENKRFYSAEFNDKCMEATNSLVESGGLTVTMFSRHGKALGGLGSLPTGLPVGKVPTLFREGNEIRYKGIIVPTSEGKDVMTLIRSGVMLGTSIRASKWEARDREFGGETVQEMVSAVLAGIDFTDSPGIAGAGVRRILEEAPVWEEEQMDWENVTLEELLENCKALLDEHAATVVEAVQERATGLEGKVEELTSTIATLTEEKEAAEAKALEAVDAVADMELKLEVAKAAHIGSISKMVFEELSQSVHTEEDIAKNLVEAKEKAMTLVLASAGEGLVKGKADVGGDDEDDVELTEEAKKVLALAR